MEVFLLKATRVVNKDSTVTAGADAKPLVTFYYYNPANKKIMSGYDLTDDIIFLWRTATRLLITMNSTRMLVMYEPMEYSKTHVSGHQRRWRGGADA